LEGAQRRSPYVFVVIDRAHISLLTVVEMMTLPLASSIEQFHDP